MILVDTNILCRLAQPTHKHHQAAKRAVNKLREQQIFYVCTQSLYEYYFVLTKPLASNGFGYSPEQAVKELQETQNIFSVIYESQKTYDAWRRLITEHKLKNRPIFDAKIVSCMIIHKIPTILTFNDQDFRYFKEISVLNPFDYMGIARIP